MTRANPRIPSLSEFADAQLSVAGRLLLTEISAEAGPLTADD
jgi:hypothetical protein